MRDPFFEHQLLQTRRQFFGNSGIRMGGVALASLAGGFGSAGSSLANTEGSSVRVHPPLSGLPHFAPKAKSIIYLHMNGGPSQIDTWDYKASLKDQFDKDLPDSIRQGQRITTMTSGQARLPVAPSKFQFNQHGLANFYRKRRRLLTNLLSSSRFTRTLSTTTLHAPSS